MAIKLFVLIILAVGQHSLPIQKKKDSIVIDYAILTACELKIQKNCIEVHGTASKILGNVTDTCAVQKMIDCFNREKKKKDCSVNDPGTVAYVDAFIKTVNKDKCMDDFGFTQVQELFQSASLGNVIEYTNAHRTYSSGDNDSFYYQTDDTEGDDTQYSGDSGHSGEKDDVNVSSSGRM